MRRRASNNSQLRWSGRWRLRHRCDNRRTSRYRCSFRQQHDSSSPHQSNGEGIDRPLASSDKRQPVEQFHVELLAGRQSESEYCARGSKNQRQAASLWPLQPMEQPESAGGSARHWTLPRSLHRDDDFQGARNSYNYVFTPNIIGNLDVSATRFNYAPSCPASRCSSL